MTTILIFISYISLVFTILVIASIAGLFSERAGIANIGIEGFMTIGAISFAIFGGITNRHANANWTQLFAILIAAISGALFALLHGFASIHLKANQIVSGTAINILAQGISLFFATSEIGVINSKAQKIITNYSSISIDKSNILSIYLIIALLIIFVVGLYFTFTKLGKHHAATGENPNAIDSVGLNVTLKRYIAIAISGAIAGLAGSFFVILLGGFFFGSTQGWGFLALAILIVGQWRVKYVSIGALIFAIFFALAEKLLLFDGINAVIKANSTLFKALPFVLSMIFMIIFAKWSKVPKAVGQPFDKSKR